MLDQLLQGILGRGNTPDKGREDGENGGGLSILAIIFMLYIGAKLLLPKKDEE